MFVFSHNTVRFVIDARAVEELIHKGPVRIDVGSSTSTVIDDLRVEAGDESFLGSTSTGRKKRRKLNVHSNVGEFCLENQS